jgi:glycosyltransferase involved in cell wall biosynthesis
VTIVDTRKISIIIPSYNEESNISTLFAGLKSVLSGLKYQFEYIFIDDGSRDSTLTEIKKLSENNNDVFYIELSRNFGHQNALKAGLDYAKGDAVISMDSDLQHPPEVILKLIEKWEEGYDVVYTKRTDNEQLSWFKRKTSSMFYSLHNKLSDMKLEKGTADFRLMSRNVVDAFSQLRESELFIRGLVMWAGFRQTAIDYVSNERHSGKSKYSTMQMVSFAFKGITSFSAKPLKLVVYLAFGLFLFSVVLVPYALISLILGYAVSGWTSLMITVIFFGSLQLLVLAIIGLYIAKLVIQSKQRPLYFIKDSNYTSTR